MKNVQPYNLMEPNEFDVRNFWNLMSMSKSGRYVIRFANGEKISGRTECEIWIKYSKRVRISKTLRQIHYTRFMERFDDPVGMIDELGYKLIDHFMNVT